MSDRALTIDSSSPPGLRHDRTPANKHQFDKILFQHIYKTGGTSINNMLSNFLTQRELNPGTEKELQGEDCFFICAHQYILQFSRSNTFTFTFLREPTRRLLSHRRQIMQAGPENFVSMAPDMVAATLALQHAPLATILDYYVYFPALIEPLWNHQAIMLGAWPLLLESGQASQSALRLHAHFPDGFAARDWLEQNRDKILERAIQTLDNLDYIGICEDFDNSVRELFESLRLPLSDVVPHFNQRERYPDEADPELWTRAKPLTELDAEIYAEACRRHGSHRNRRVNRADFLKRTVAAGEDQIFDANAQPGGHGWHYPQLRHDGLPSRWTGPGSRSSVYFGTAAAGRYCFQLYAFGAVSPESLLAMMIWINNQIIPARAEELPQGEWQVTANFSQETEGPLDIELFVPIVIDGVGVEVRGWRIKSLDPPATAITSVDENSVPAQLNGA